MNFLWAENSNYRNIWYCEKGFCWRNLNYWVFLSADIRFRLMLIITIRKTCRPRNHSKCQSSGDVIPAYEPAVCYDCLLGAGSPPSQLLSRWSLLAGLLISISLQTSSELSRGLWLGVRRPSISGAVLSWRQYNAQRRRRAVHFCILISICGPHGDVDVNL